MPHFFGICSSFANSIAADIYFGSAVIYVILKHYLETGSAIGVGFAGRTLP
jgi:hypothetical protein